jgi:long-chain acyl-CoA synthetase
VWTRARVPRLSEPFALLPLALAGGGGRVDDVEAQQAVAAGLTLLQRSAPLVRALAGRRAAIILSPGASFITALAASEGRGAVLVNPLAAPLEVSYQLRDADVGAVLTSAPLAPKVPEGVPLVLLDDAPRSARVVAGGSSRDVDLGAHFGLPLEGDADAPGRDEEAAIVYTSAMHGTPLGAILTHRNLLANARATIEAARLEREDHALALLPFAHLFGLIVSGAAPLLAGGRLTCMERFHPVRALELLESSEITMLVAVPSVFAALAQLLERRGKPLAARALRVCICGGAPLRRELQDRWATITGVELRQGYGLTEAGPVCLFNRVDLPNRRGTLGVPFPGIEVEIRDPGSRAELDAGAEGEIWVAGENVRPGYVRGGELGLARDGRWLRTGDAGVRHADGTVTFRRVLKPMFTRNGFNIYPREIELAAAELPGVRGATVRAIPDPLREHEIALDVEGAVSEARVREWCAERLSAYKQPSEVTVRA